MCAYQGVRNVSFRFFLLFAVSWPFKRQSHKMVKRTQTIRRQIADELFECAWPFYDIGT